MAGILIEDGVPIPQSHAERRRTDGKETLYPFRSLGVGQSFYVAAPNLMERERIHERLKERKKTIQRATGRKFVMRKLPEGVRVWRSS